MIPPSEADGIALCEAIKRVIRHYVKEKLSGFAARQQLRIERRTGERPPKPQLDVFEPEVSLWDQGRVLKP